MTPLLVVFGLVLLLHMTSRVMMIPMNVFVKTFFFQEATTQVMGTDTKNKSTKSE